MTEEPAADVRGLGCFDLGPVTSVRSLAVDPKASVLENIGGWGLNSSHLCPTNKILPKINLKQSHKR